jgi:hypothetical protein
MSTTALAANTLPSQSILQRLSEYALPLCAFSVIFFMLVPQPGAALDFLLALSMAASIIRTRNLSGRSKERDILLARSAAENVLPAAHRG